MPALETVIVLNKNGPVIINKSDYDPLVHELAEGQDDPLAAATEPAATEPAAFDREQAKEFLSLIGVTFPRNISNEKLAELVQENKAKLAGA